MRIAIIMLMSLCTTARAEPKSFREEHPFHRRGTHLAAIVFGGGIYLTTETIGKRAFVPDSCKWCTPPSIDTSVRDSLKWSDTGKARDISDIGSFLIAPGSAVGLVMIASLGTSDSQGLRWIDDTLPIVESALVASLANQAVKIGVARQRPFAHFEDPSVAPTVEDNLSFYSGHTTHAFAFAVSAGVVASKRGYALAPVIWTSGLLIAGTTGYLRIAADKHYFTDVVAGAAAGSAIGVAVPLLFHSNVLVTPSREGVAVAGAF
jgi:membrane-associated phospholipid phosphatase